MKIMNGISLSPGTAIGTALVLENAAVRNRRSINTIGLRKISREHVQVECARMDEALANSERELEGFAEIGRDNPTLAVTGKLISAHIAMACELASSAKTHVASNLVEVETSLDHVIDDWIVRLQDIGSGFLREREVDIRDVGERMMRHLNGVESILTREIPPGTIVVAYELAPSDAIALANSGITAIVTQHGSKLGHTAIIARSLGIPLTSHIELGSAPIATGDRLLVNGTTGTVAIRPTREYEESFRFLTASDPSLSLVPSISADGLCRTRDGTEIEIRGNIGLQHEVDQVLQHGLAGVGLFRTEFLFLKSNLRPDSALQHRIYDDMANRLGNLLTIRTFDLGGDKLPSFLEVNTQLHESTLRLRGLRFSLAEQELLREQLRAIVDAAQTSEVRVLFPMVIGGCDLKQAIDMLGQVASDRNALKSPSIGAMIETPASVFSLDEILALCDFISIGTNDLTQFLLSSDRDLTFANDDCTATHPAVLRAIFQIIEAAERWGIPVSVCGEEAGEPLFAELLIGLGIRELSISPSRTNEVRATIRRIDLSRSRDLAMEALSCQSPAEVRQLFSLSRGFASATESAIKQHVH